MIDLETIEREISDVEAVKDTTYRACERLAWLYIVRDHLKQRDTEAVTDSLRGSDFLEAASNVSYRKLMAILDEHMSALAVVNPKQYDSIMERINALR